LPIQYLPYYFGCTGWVLDKNNNTFSAIFNAAKSMSGFTDSQGRAESHHLIGSQDCHHSVNDHDRSHVWFGERSLQGCKFVLNGIDRNDLNGRKRPIKPKLTVPQRANAQSGKEVFVYVSEQPFDDKAVPQTGPSNWLLHDVLPEGHTNRFVVIDTHTLKVAAWPYAVLVPLK
jgi:hypothetical protein